LNKKKKMKKRVSKLSKAAQEKTEDQTLVRRWIEERLKQEAGIALRLSQMPIPEVVAALNRRLTWKLPT
jgi:RNase P subunit RPR2